MDDQPNGNPLRGRGRVHLPLAKYVKLTEWLRTHCDGLWKEKPTLIEAAGRAQKDLGFPLTAHHLRAAMDATGVAWDSRERRGAKTTPRPVGDRLRRLEAAVVFLADALGVGAQMPPVGPAKEEVANG
jgi:hypothetical protein